jgi:septal ring factor EnvC (AmiA/AmiB activator)
MTTVGKILVLFIMVFSLILSAVSSVVFTTSKNWKTATEVERKKVADLTAKLNDAVAQTGAATKDLETQKGNYEAEAKKLNDRIAAVEQQNQLAQQQITTAAGQVATAQQSAKTALDEAEANRKEALLLRDQKSAVEQQANEFKLHVAELNDKIREMERALDSATKNNSDLKERVAKYSTLLRSNGLSDDIAQITGTESPPPVVGEAKRVDANNRRFEITVGSNDGLVVGHELYIMRTSPRAEYLGKAKVVSVEPNQAVVQVIGNTYQGKKIQEGDIVSSTIRPRL